MKNLTPKLWSERGTTLIELMIALSLTGIISLAIMKTYATQHENYLAQDDVAYMQQNARSCIDELTRQIRMAGHSVPAGLPAIVASNTDPDTITVTYHGNDLETFLTAKMASTSAALVCDDISDFRAGQRVYIFDGDSGVGEWLQISGVNASSKTIQRSSPVNLSRQYDADAIVRALNQVKFFVDKTSDPEKPTLMLQVGNSSAQPYAENISDLQFQYRFVSGTVLDAPIVLQGISEIMISIEAASYRSGSDNESPTADGEKNKRVYSTSVSLRNLDS